MIHPHTTTLPLSGLRTGETACILSLGRGHGVCMRLASLGFTPGVEISMIQNFGHGPLIVAVRGTRIALGRHEAEKISVRRGE